MDVSATRGAARRNTRGEAAEIDAAPAGIGWSHAWASRPASEAPAIHSLPLPVQIADHLGHQIFRGKYRPGLRLKETELAQHYQVSRGPIREAFRILERRGIVEIVPRHGARVRALDLADIDTLFNIRAVLFGLAARQATERSTPRLIAELSAQVQRFKHSAETMAITPLEHATLAGDTQRIIAGHTGSSRLVTLLEEMNNRALWRMIWCEKPLDFNTQKRRQQSAQFWRDLLRAVKAGDANGAERTARALIEASRDHTLAALRALGLDRPAGEALDGAPESLAMASGDAAEAAASRR